MRTLLALLAASLLVPLALPATQAQTPDAGATHLLDGDANVQVVAAGQGGLPNGGRFQDASLKALDASEAQDAVTLTLTVSNLKNYPEAPLLETIIYHISFRHNDRVFQVQITRNVAGSSATYSAQLQAYDPGRGSYSTLLRSLPVTAAEDAGTLAVTLGKDLLVDLEGNAPQPAVPFTGWHVTATNVGTNFFGNGGTLCPPSGGCQQAPQVQASDAMPTQGNGTTDLVMKFGLVQTGNARLSSPIPTRASNGEATTIVYQVTARNLGPASDMFMLGSTGVPSGWQVQLPAEHVTIPGNGSLAMPVLVTMPFTHQHGAYYFFVLTMTSMKDPGSVGRIQLGVRFSQPPQPAGHHNTLWLHTEDNSNFFDSVPNGPTVTDQVIGNGASLYMNALDPDPADNNEPVAGQNCGIRGQGTTVQGSYCWNVPLSPGLEIGLDFDMNGTGKLSIPISSQLPMPGATLTGMLLYYPPANQTQNGGQFGPRNPVDNSIQLCQVNPSAPKDIAAGSGSTPVFLDADLKPIVKDPYIPFAKGASLVLQLEVDYTGGASNAVFLPNTQTPPYVAPGGTVENLPLFEYHDRVNQLFAASSALMLSADSPQDRMANPGHEDLFNLTLMNHGSAPSTVDLQLEGVHTDWAQMVAPAKTEVTLPAGAMLPVSVVVRIPANAVPSDGMGGHGDMADLVLSATGTADLNLRTLARLHVMVDNTRAWPSDEAAIQAIQGAHAKKTPGMEAPLLAVGLLAAVLAARRRRVRAA